MTPPTPEPTAEGDALAAASLLLVDPTRGLDRVGKDDAVGVCEFFNVYPETVGRMVSAGLLRGVTTRVAQDGPQERVKFAPMVGVGLRAGGLKLVSVRLFVPDAEAVERAFREASAATWRGCILHWPHFFRAMGLLRAAEVVRRCAHAGGLP